MSVDTDIPTVTEEGIKARIKYVNYTYHSLLTMCIITLENDFVVTGESSCVSALKYNMQVGEQMAYQHAFDKIWLLEGYLLRERLYQESLAA